jgi:GNAT superfamily N-acetyltransferase
MLRLRTMTVDDLELGDRLRAQAGWNQTAEDWRRFLSLEPEGCFVAEWNGRPAGTTVTCTFGSVAWVAMVLVDPSIRGQGIGTRLIEHALAWLDQRGVPSIRLDATPLGRPIYLKLGFVDEYELVRMEGTVDVEAFDRPASSPAGDVDFETLCQLDLQATATPRRSLLEALRRQQPSALRVTREAYLMYRPGSRAVQIGPGVACRPADGIALADWALGQCRGRRVFIDIPTANQPAIDWACTRGLVEQRRLMRMCRGPRVTDHADWIWASSGPEMG